MLSRTETASWNTTVELPPTGCAMMVGTLPVGTPGANAVTCTAILRPLPQSRIQAGWPTAIVRRAAEAGAAAWGYWTAAGVSAVSADAAGEADAGPGVTASEVSTGSDP